MASSDMVYRWLKNLDVKMHQQERKIILLLDNFSGHYVDFIPQNIQVNFFAPNLTSFVQPCDGSIIYCFKAHYRQAFCICALNLEEAGEHEIYKVNLLEAMLMAKDTWNAVTQDTIRHCWDHTKIQQDLVSYTPPVPSTIATSPFPPTSPLAYPKAWEIVREFAVSDMSLPQVEEQLKDYLGCQYIGVEWSGAFKTVMDAENDTLKALESIKTLTDKFIKPSQPLDTATTAIPNAALPCFHCPSKPLCASLWI